MFLSIGCCNKQVIKHRTILEKLPESWQAGRCKPGRIGAIFQEKDIFISEDINDFVHFIRTNATLRIWGEVSNEKRITCQSQLGPNRHMGYPVKFPCLLQHNLTIILHRIRKKRVHLSSLDGFTKVLSFADVQPAPWHHRMLQIVALGKWSYRRGFSKRMRAAK